MGATRRSRRGDFVRQQRQDGRAIGDPGMLVISLSAVVFWPKARLGVSLVRSFRFLSRPRLNKCFFPLLFGTMFRGISRVEEGPSMKAPVIRISIGKFDADKASIVEGKLQESRASLESGIRAMSGNIAYYVGIDRLNNAMHNVSVWESVSDANQMATFAPMLALGEEFAKQGVRFDRPILNCDTLWQLDKGTP
jgi:hypothetical protein